MTYSLGVDLGTTFTAAAVCQPGGQPSMVSLGASGYAIPSVLFLRDDGTFLVGEGAEMRATADPTRVARYFKRQLGDSGSRFIGGTPYSAQALTARLLAHVLNTVADRQGEQPGSVVLTHPANWGPYRREVLEQAAAMAGVTAQVQLVSEPEAAASHYAKSERVDAGELIGVYDLGGGTFDAVIMRRTTDGFEVVGQPQGVERLGGVDFDDVIWAFVAEASDLDMSEMMNSDDEAVLAAGHALRNSCVDAKRLLSVDTNARIRVALPSVNRSVRLNRKEFENRIRPRLVETIMALEAALTSGNVAATDLSRILLVGGSSRIPLVNQLLAQHFGRPIAVDSDPKNTVALGAALRGTLDHTIDVDDPFNEAFIDPAIQESPPEQPMTPAPLVDRAPPARLTPPPTSDLSPSSSAPPDIDLSSIPTPPDGIGPIIDLTDSPEPPIVPQRLVSGSPPVHSSATDSQTSASEPLAPQRPNPPSVSSTRQSAEAPRREPQPADQQAFENQTVSELDSLQAESRHRVSMPTTPRKENPYQPVDPKQVGDLTSTGRPSPMLIAVAGLLVTVIVIAVVIRLITG